MEEYRKKDDRGRSKAARLTKNDPHQKVDSSTWTPDAAENAGIKTGARPLVKRLFKKGGKVVGKCEGGEAMRRADRKPRKAGGRALTADSLINRDVREANSEREGIKHDGAFKKGGKVRRAEGGYINIGGARVKDTPEAKLAHVRKTFPNVTHVTPEGHPDWAKMGVKMEGKKSGGRTHKFGGGMLGNNPVADQYQKNADAASHKKGGKVHRRHYATYGTVEEALADNPMPRKEMETLNAKSPATEQAPPAEEPYKYKGPAPKTNPNTGYKKGGHVDEAKDKALIKRMVKPSALERKHGGGIFSGNSMEKIPGAVGGRHAHAKGGRTKGTTVNIIMARGHDQQQSMPNAPMLPPKPPVGVPVPPPGMAGGAPQGMPPQMPPQMPRATGGRTGKMVGGSLGNAGGMQPMQQPMQQPMMGQPMQPPMGYPMPRKSGGRTGYPIDSGAGGGNARLEKIDAYGLKPRGK